MITPYTPPSPSEFWADLNIYTDAGPRRWGDVMADFQREDLAALDNALRVLVGLPTDATAVHCLRHFWEYCRGSAKTTTLAAISLFLAYSSPHPITGQLAAGDADQARLQVEAARLLVGLNPKLSVIVKDPNDRNRKKPLIEVQQNVIRNVLTGSAISVVSSDSASAYGRLDNIIVLDEFSNLRGNARPFFDAIISTAAKKANCVVLLVGNAPFVDSWQWEIRETCRTSDRWYFSRMETPAPWIRPELLEEQRQLLPPMAYARLWENKPVEGQGDALGVDVIDAAFSAGVPVMMNPADPFHSRDRWAFVGALDLSVSRDWSAFVVVGRNQHGRYRLARRWVWRPAPGQKISQENVRQTIREAHRTYRLQRVVCDPFQAEATVELLRKDSIRIETRPQSGQALMDQAMQLVELFNTFAIDLPPEYEDLRKQLLQTRVEQRSYGLRLVSPRTADGAHGDIVSALSIALPAASQVMPLGGGTWGGPIPSGSTHGIGGGAPWTRQTGSSLHTHLALAAARGEIELLPSPYRMITPEQREASQ